MVQTSASPGLDFCGRVKAKHPANESFVEGQLAFGALATATKFPKFGSLGQLLVAPCSQITPLPKGVDPDGAAAVGAVGMKALQALPGDIVKPESKVFIDGGSGGVALGAEATTTCSTANVQLCRSLGVDKVMDYRELNLLDELKRKGQVFDLVVDNVGVPSDLHERSDLFLKPSGVFSQVAMQNSMGAMIRRSILLGCLGGGRRPLRVVRVNINSQDFEQVGRWMADGKVHAVIDEKFEWKDAPKAYEKLRKGRTMEKLWCMSVISERGPVRVKEEERARHVN
ncbi:hypothetical protein QQZ08_004850 [Neonectria magnoliae]|uniref:Enoyl reductase (ER) domain-containing protein n=1 Tax=Neonectria magnoliae TaxID=2732573 RepID=A0ABR1I4W3_9HYPO